MLAFERLLRKLLQLKRTPAVVLMEFLATDVKQKNLPFHATGNSSTLQFYLLTLGPYQRQADDRSHSSKCALSLVV